MRDLYVEFGIDHHDVDNMRAVAWALTILEDGGLDNFSVPHEAKKAAILNLRRVIRRTAKAMPEVFDSEYQA